MKFTTRLTNDEQLRLREKRNGCFKLRNRVEQTPWPPVVFSDACYVIENNPFPIELHCATSRKVAGSIPDEVIGFFNWPNPSSRTMALGSTQFLTEMSTRNLPVGQRAAGA
jgi:hypothetical protein